MQGRIDRSELGIELGAESVHHGNDSERNACSDQSVFNGGCAGVVGKEPANGFHSSNMKQKTKGTLNLIRETVARRPAAENGPRLRYDFVVERGRREEAPEHGRRRRRPSPSVRRS